MYNIPEEGHNVYVSLSAEPTYKVFEGPNPENVESLGEQGTVSTEEPIYNNILKGRNSDDL